MVNKIVAPYGEWESVISLDDATAGSKSLSSPRGDVQTGRVFYLESKPSGANGIVEVITTTQTHPDDTGVVSPQLRQVLPDPHSVSTSVYEYGAGPYEVLPAVQQSPSQGGAGASARARGQRIIFSDGKDGNALKVLHVDTGHVTVLRSGKPWLRYSDFGVHVTGPGSAAAAAGAAVMDWVLAIEEDHPDGAPHQDVQNYVVGIHVATGTVVRLVAGADFYTNPRFSRDGRWVSWRQWEHPEMPWTKSELYWAPVRLLPLPPPPPPPRQGDVEGEGEAEGGLLALGEATRVAGGQPEEPVGEALWGPDGALYFAHEVVGNDWRQLFRAWPGKGGAAAAERVEKVHLKGLEETEIGTCSMMFDSRTFGFLSETTMVLQYTKNAINGYVHVDLPTLKVTHLEVPLIDARPDPVAPISATSFLVIGAGSTLQQGVYHVTLDATNLDATTTLLSSASSSASSSSYPPHTFSAPEPISFVSQREPKRPIHGFYWPPYNPKFTAPEGTLPPLLINPHGGPTGHSGAGLKTSGTGGGGGAAFWTSRGFAYFVINYTGSSGHGHAYRQRLQTQWGVLDRDDVPECIDYLCSGASDSDTRGGEGQGTTKSPRADRARVGIHGGSAGGYNVLQTLTWYPSVLAAGVSYCGISDLGTMAEGTHKLEAHYLDGLLYDVDHTSEAEKTAILRARSPLYHAQRIRAPLLLVHGDRDTVVPIAQSYEIAERIRQGDGDGDGDGAPRRRVEMVVAPGEGHMFKMRASQRMALEREVEWFIEMLARK